MKFAHAVFEIREPKDKKTLITILHALSAIPGRSINHSTQFICRSCFTQSRPVVRRPIGLAAVTAVGPITIAVFRRMADWGCRSRWNGRRPTCGCCFQPPTTSKTFCWGPAAADSARTTAVTSPHPGGCLALLSWRRAAAAAATGRRTGADAVRSRLRRVFARRAGSNDRPRKTYSTTGILHTNDT